MAHLLKSSPLDPFSPAIWNVDQSVGVGGSNLLEDIILVQYMLVQVGKSPISTLSTATRAQLQVLMMTGICDEYTIACIKAVQTAIKLKNPTQLVDGKISRAAPGLKVGANYYTIVMINGKYKQGYWGNWPCICMDADNPTITNLVYRELYGTTP